jgi:hypothetical protein
MRPVRTITDLLFAPAIAITGRSGQPATLQTGAPDGAPPAPGTPIGRHLRGLAGSWVSAWPGWRPW